MMHHNKEMFTLSIFVMFNDIPLIMFGSLAIYIITILS